jgi:predicted nucleotidyltransferase component of viral defense system
MKDHLRTLVDAHPSAVERRNVAREYLQARILAVLQRAGAMMPLAFHGGTALRLLYDIPRWSEDLNFALERPSAGYDFRKMLTSVTAELSREGYGVQIKLSDGRVVHSAFVSFPGLPFELGFSGRVQELISIKIEVDTRPPAGAGIETSIVRRHAILQLQHHDRASLFAGKLHAVLQRPYAKGRDFFDLLWYLSDSRWPEPNLVLLNNALRQSGYEAQALSPSSWRRAVRKRIASLDFGKLQADLAPFLDSSVEPSLVAADRLSKLLSG